MERDGLPESIEYRDTGCDLAPKCLECPFPVCVHDGGPVRLSTLKHVDRLAELLREGRTMAEAAVEMGLSRRSVYRLRQKYGHPAQGGGG